MHEPQQDALTEQIIRYLKNGENIRAIKMYREHTGSGLAESKEAIDQIAAQLRQAYPDQVPAKKAGCATAVFIGVAGIAALVVSAF